MSLTKQTQLFLSESTNCDVFDVHANRLDGVLKSWNFKCIPVTSNKVAYFMQSHIPYYKHKRTVAAPQLDWWKSWAAHLKAVQHNLLDC